MAYKLIIIVALVVFLQNAFAAEYEVAMRNSGADGFMVFEPGFLKIDKGDTVKFVPVDTGHNSASYYTPEGGTTWNGALNGSVSATFNEEGVYIYQCTPHIVAGMAGVIQVGEAANLEEAKKAGEKLKATMAAEKQRIDKYLSQVQ